MGGGEIATVAKFCTKVYIDRNLILTLITTKYIHNYYKISRITLINWEKQEKEDGRKEEFNR